MEAKKPHEFHSGFKTWIRETYSSSLELSEDSDMCKGIEEDKSHQYHVRLTEETLGEDEELEMVTGTEIKISPFNPYDADIYETQ